MANFRLHRRSVLRGTGITLTLPWLEVMQPLAAAEQKTSGPPRRLLCVFQPNGVYPAAWDVQGTGRNYQISRILEPLQDLRNDVTILSNLDNVTAGNHVRMTSAFLTGAGVDSGQCPASLDQIVASQIGSQTMLPSIELGTEPPRQGGDGKSPIAFANTVSWSTDGSRISPEINPRVAFDRLFRHRTNPAAKQQAADQKSILDLVLQDARSLRSRISTSDRHKLDEYLESVRSVEVRIDRSINPPERSWEPLSQPDLIRPADGIPRRRDEHLRIMMDLMVLAMQTDSTRVGTLMTAHGFSRQNFSFLDGVTSDHHGMSHHQEKPDAVEEYIRVSHWYIKQFAYLLQRMKSVDEGYGSLLDNSIVLYGSGMKDGNGHKKQDLPILLAGSGQGALKPGQHIALKPHTPLANLHLTLAQKFGIEADSFNHASTGTISELS